MSLNESNPQFANYFEAIAAYLAGDSQQVQTILGSNQLNRVEKELIHVRVLMRDRDWLAAEEKLAQLTTTNDFYLGELHFLLGNVHGFNANWEKSILSNLTAQYHFELCQNARGLFLTNYNLSSDYSNLGLYQISSAYLSRAQKNSQSSQHQSQIFRGLAWNELQLGHFQKSLKYVELGLQLSMDTYPSERNMFLAVAADIYFRVGKTAEAFDILKSLQYSKAIRDKSRIHFELKLLEKMLTESAPYSSLDYPSDELRRSPEYTLKWNVIRHLLNGEKQMADDCWTQLCAKFPLLYTVQFQCVEATESKSVFISFLQKIMDAKCEAPTLAAVADGVMLTKLQKLVHLLTTSPIGLRKEDIIENIWEQKYDPKMDAKLYKLIQRLRDQSGFEIISQNQCYYLRKI